MEREEILAYRVILGKKGKRGQGEGMDLTDLGEKKVFLDSQDPE